MPVITTALFVLGASPCFGQTAAPPTGPVLRFDVNLVQVDATVTDHKGRHVPGLQPDQFEVWQDGKPQKIAHFEYVTVNQPASAAPDRY